MDQVKDLLEVVGSALKSVSERKIKEEHRKTKAMDARDESTLKEVQRQTAIRYGNWHDGRMDCVAGNGVMSELGIGIERTRLEDYEIDPAELMAAEAEAESRLPQSERKEKNKDEVQALKAMPIVVIKNYATRRGQDEIIKVMSTWAASLVENGVAHVIVASDNRENAKQMAQGQYLVSEL